MLNHRQRQRAARVMQALAHPVRLGVLQCLATREHTVTELYEALGCSQSMMSQQLRLLAAQGLVRWRKAGVVKHCRLGNRDFLKLFGCLETHLRRLPPNRRQRKD
jgi:DNA-binding transcriptional ArsR family regulator